MTDIEYFEKAIKRFWANVDMGAKNECWEWQKCLHPKGYGMCGFKGMPTRRAHRIAWILTYGQIPEKISVCHICDNPPCCNPSHLFLGTQKDNMVDCATKGRKGQKLSEADVIAIRHKYTIEGISQTMIAKQFGINRRTVSQIVAGETWAWVKYLPSNGLKQSRSKLSDNDIRMIRAEYATGRITNKEIGDIYCVNVATVSKITSMTTRKGAII